MPLPFGIKDKIATHIDRTVAKGLDQAVKLIKRERQQNVKLRAEVARLRAIQSGLLRCYRCYGLHPVSAMNTETVDPESTACCPACVDLHKANREVKRLREEIGATTIAAQELVRESIPAAVREVRRLREHGDKELETALRDALDYLAGTWKVAAPEWYLEARRTLAGKGE